MDTLCTGCDICRQLCPDTFEITDDLVATVIDLQGDPEEDIQHAIDLCPEDCIRWRELPVTPQGE